MITNQRIRISAALVIAVISLIYFLVKAMDLQESIDFKYIWLAGNLWHQGITPYGTGFQDVGARLFWYSNIPTRFYYPPSWYPLSFLFSTSGFGQSVIMWRIFSAFLLIAGAAIYIATFRKIDRTVGIVQYSLFFAFAAASSMTAHTLSTGQTSILIFFGTALFFRGYALNRPVLLSAALVLLMLKPNFGMPFVVFCLVRRERWLPVIGAGVVSVIMALPALIPYDPAQVLKDYVAILGQHNQEPVNFPACLTGLRNLFFYAFGFDASAYPPIALACIGAGVIGGLAKNERVSKDARFLTLMSVALFCVPLHSYDLVIIAPLVLVDWRKSAVATVAVSAGLIVLFRVNKFATLTGLTTPGESLVTGTLAASLALALVMAGMLIYLRRAWVEGREARPAGFPA